MKERNYNYDLMRVLACLMIICMHAPMPSENAPGLFLNVISYFTSPGLCLFFVLSGALLLPAKTYTFLFLKKRLGKVIMPTLCFTVLYLILGNNDDLWGLRTICSIPFSAQGNGVLWFMYTLIGLYLLVPILSRWLEKSKKREVELYLLLWCITLCYPLLQSYLKINTGNTGILYYFTGYAGYFLLGYYLKTYPNAITMKRIIVPAIIAALSPIAYKLLHIEIDFYSSFGYLSIWVAILCVTYYIVLLRPLKILMGGVLVTISNLCFGIYLVHIAIMRNFLWKLDIIQNISNYFLQWFIVVSATFILSLGLCYAISLLPFGDYIIGYKHKKRQ